MAADDSDDGIEASADPLRWPDPSRPIINERWDTHGPGYVGVDPRDMAPDAVRQPRRWPLIAAAILLLALALVAVWLLWWQ